MYTCCEDEGVDDDVRETWGEVEEGMSKKGRERVMLGNVESWVGGEGEGERGKGKERREEGTATWTGKGTGNEKGKGGSGAEVEEETKIELLTFLNSISLRGIAIVAQILPLPYKRYAFPYVH